MNHLSFNIIQSESTNDHQVRILVDGEDILEDDAGIDPPDFFEQESLLNEGKLFIRRCECGCMGCGDVVVNVQCNNNEVTWQLSKNKQYIFDKTDYARIINAAMVDFSWEDIKRMSERLIDDIFRNTYIEDNYRFVWSSTRRKENTITLAFYRDCKQKLFELPWDGKTIENALNNAKRFIKIKLNKVLTE